MNQFEPSGNARMAAGALWDLYRGYVDVGFTPAQAMQFVTVMLTEQIRGMGNQP